MRLASEIKILDPVIKGQLVILENIVCYLFMLAKKAWLTEVLEVIGISRDQHTIIPTLVLRVLQQEAKLKAEPIA